MAEKSRPEGYWRKYYHANRAKIREKAKAFYHKVKADSKWASRYKRTRAKWYRARPEEQKHKERKRASEWYRNNKERATAARKRYYAANRKQIGKQNRANRLRRQYGLTPQQYREMWKRQGKRCAVCLKRPRTKARRHVDHCHDTGKVRGILCQSCNHGLGFLPTVKVLKQAIRYLMAQ